MKAAPTTTTATRMTNASSRIETLAFSMSSLRRRNRSTIRFSMDGVWFIQVSGVQSASQRHSSHAAAVHSAMIIAAAM